MLKEGIFQADLKEKNLRKNKMDKVTVTYIKHSGFLVETKESYLLFDYWEGKLPELQYDKELYVFSSHAHHDHYTKDIFKLENKCKKVDLCFYFGY